MLLFVSHAWQEAVHMCSPKLKIVALNMQICINHIVFQLKYTTIIQLMQKDHPSYNNISKYNTTGNVDIGLF